MVKDKFGFLVMCQIWRVKKQKQKFTVDLLKKKKLQKLLNSKQTPLISHLSPTHSKFIFLFKKKTKTQ